MRVEEIQGARNPPQGWPCGRYGAGSLAPVLRIARRRGIEPSIRDRYARTVNPFDPRDPLEFGKVAEAWQRLWASREERLRFTLFVWMLVALVALGALWQASVA
jgi:hypothetical protein